MITYCPRCGARFAEERHGALFDFSLQCDDCALRLTEPPAMLAKAGADEEIDYALGDWLVPERSAATAALVGVDIPYRWEADLVLVVPAVAEEEVDVLLDELDDPGDEPHDDDEQHAGAGGDGGAVAQEAMGELFVAADRLQHDPLDDRMAGELMMAAGTVGASPPPYGIERPVWRQIQALAATLATDLEEAADEETVAAGARALREYLRDLV